MWSWLQKLMSFFQGEDEQRIEEGARPPVQPAPRQLQAKTKSIYPKERAYSRSEDEYRREKERQFRFPVVPDDYLAKKGKKADRTEPSQEQRIPARDRYQGTARDSETAVRDTPFARLGERNIESSRKVEKQPTQSELSRERTGRKTEGGVEPLVRPRQPDEPKKAYKPSEIVSPVYGKITPTTRETEHRIHTTAGIVYPRLEQEEQLQQLKQWEQQQKEKEKENDQPAEELAWGVPAEARGETDAIGLAAEPRLAPVQQEEPASGLVEAMKADASSEVHTAGPVSAAEVERPGMSALAVEAEGTGAAEVIAEQAERAEAVEAAEAAEAVEVVEAIEAVEIVEEAESVESVKTEADELIEQSETIEAVERKAAIEAIEASNAGEEDAIASAKAMESEPSHADTAYSAVATREDVGAKAEAAEVPPDDLVSQESDAEAGLNANKGTELAGSGIEYSGEFEESDVPASVAAEESEASKGSSAPFRSGAEPELDADLIRGSADAPATAEAQIGENASGTVHAELAITSGGSDSVLQTDSKADWAYDVNRLLERAEIELPAAERDVAVHDPFAQSSAAMNEAAAATVIQEERIQSESVEAVQEQSKSAQSEPIQAARPQSEPVQALRVQSESAQTAPAEAQVSEPVTAYRMPELDLLNPGAIPSDDDDEHTQLQKLLLEETLSNFNVSAQVVGIVKGPSVTRFELQPAPGVKVNKITSLIDDIKLNLAAKDIRIEAPIPGRNAIGIEVPNLSSRPVMISTIIGSDKFQEHSSPLAVALGMDIGGEPIVADIKKMPHGLIAGSTGSGKSVCINSIIVSLLYKATPEQVRLLLIDPKMVELAPYNHLPHLVTPVVTEAKQATAALKWAVEEMEKRYALFVDAGVRDIDRYNQTTDDTLPYIVIVIDELADLMMVSPQDVEDCIIRIAQKARACGIHLLLATQRPSVDVITGNIKANVPTRLAFAVFSQVDSRTILDQSGAERLLGRGDMLFLESGTTPLRLQGNFVSDDEIERITQAIKKQRKPSYLFSKEDLEQQVQSYDSGDDPLYMEALVFVAEQGQASASGLQRRFRVGYNRAARLIEMMEADGYVAGQSGGKARAVLISREDAQAIVDGSTLV